MMPKPWKHISSRLLAETRVFTVNAHTRISEETSREAEFYVLDSTDWVNVVALTTDGELVMVEQFRHGVSRVTLEIPGGMVDLTDASPEVAARRELEEETGYTGGDWSAIGVVDPNPATHSNRCFTFLARNVVLTKPPRPDGLEELDLRLVPRADVPELLRRGEITHALVVAALHWWALAEE